MRSRLIPPASQLPGSVLLAALLAAAFVVASVALPGGAAGQRAGALPEPRTGSLPPGTPPGDLTDTAGLDGALTDGARSAIERAAAATWSEPGARRGPAPSVARLDVWVAEPDFAVAAVDLTRPLSVGGGGRAAGATAGAAAVERVVVTAARDDDGEWDPSVAAPLAARSAGSGTPARSVAAPPGPDVEGDHDAGAIVAEGSVLLPGSFTGDPAVRDEATDCPGCLWRLDLACPTQDLCAGAFVGCEPMELRWLVRLLRPPATDFAVVGTLCRGSGEELLGVDALAARVSERFVELLPRAEPSVQPTDGALVQIPALFAAGEPTTFGPVDLDIVGYAVNVSARAEWWWNFGDGGSLVTDSPGGAYPDRSVAHVFGRAGTYDVTVTTRWSGEFTVNGDGPYPIAGGPVALSAPLEVQVREAGAVLVTP